MRDAIIRLHEPGIMRADNGQAEFVGQFQQSGFAPEFSLGPVPGDLDIAAAGIGGGERREFRPGVCHPALLDVARDLTLRPARQQDQSGRIFEQQAAVEFRHTVRRIEEGPRRQEHEPLVAGVILGIQRHPRRLGPRGGVGYVKTARHDRLHAVLSELHRQLQRPKHVIAVRDAGSRRNHALEQRIARADCQRDE